MLFFYKKEGMMNLSEKLPADKGCYLRSAGVTVYEEGDHVDCLYLLLNGRVKISSQGQELTTLEAWTPIGKNRQDSGETFVLLNEIEAILDLPSGVSVKADTDCIMVIISRRDFFRRIGAEGEEGFKPQASLLLFKHLARRAHQMRQQIVELKERLAESRENLEIQIQRIMDLQSQNAELMGRVIGDIDPDQLVDSLGESEVTQLLDVGRFLHLQKRDGE